MKVSITFVNENGSLPTEVFHQISCEYCDCLEAQGAYSLEHVKLIAAFGFLLLKIEARTARGDNVQAVVIQIFGDSADRGLGEMRIIDDVILTVAVGGKSNKLTDAVFARGSNDQVHAVMCVGVECGNRCYGRITLIIIFFPSDIDEIGQDAFSSQPTLGYLNHRGNLGYIRIDTFSNCRLISKLLFSGKIESIIKHFFEH